MARARSRAGIGADTVTAEHASAWTTHPAWASAHLQGSACRPSAASPPCTASTSQLGHPGRPVPSRSAPGHTVPVLRCRGQRAYQGGRSATARAAGGHLTDPDPPARRQRHPDRRVCQRLGRCELQRRARSARNSQHQVRQAPPGAAAPSHHAGPDPQRRTAAPSPSTVGHSSTVLSTAGTRLPHSIIGLTFTRLAGLSRRSASYRPRVHDLRHCENTVLGFVPRRRRHPGPDFAAVHPSRSHRPQHTFCYLSAPPRASRPTATSRRSPCRDDPGHHHVGTVPPVPRVLPELFGGAIASADPRDPAVRAAAPARHAKWHWVQACFSMPAGITGGRIALGFYREALPSPCPCGIISSVGHLRPLAEAVAIDRRECAILTVRPLCLTFEQGIST